MSIEENKAVVRRLWDEVWNEERLEVADEIFAPEYAVHEKEFIGWMRSVFPDHRHVVEDLIGEGDKVVTRWTFRGTHRSEILGISATGRPIEVTGIWIHRLADGKIVEGQQWGNWDALGLVRQLGAEIVSGSEGAT